MSMNLCLDFIDSDDNIVYEAFLPQIGTEESSRIANSDTPKEEYIKYIEEHFSDDKMFVGELDYAYRTYSKYQPKWGIF